MQLLLFLELIRLLFQNQQEDQNHQNKLEVGIMMIDKLINNYLFKIKIYLFINIKVVFYIFYILII